MSWLWFLPVALVALAVAAARWSADVARKRVDHLAEPAAASRRRRHEVRGVDQALGATSERYRERQ